MNSPESIGFDLITALCVVTINLILCLANLRPASYLNAERLCYVPTPEHWPEGQTTNP